MSHRMGRPTTDPRGNNRAGVRLTESDMKNLEFCVKETGMTKTEIIRKGIEKFYNELLTHTKDKNEK